MKMNIKKSSSAKRKIIITIVLFCLLLLGYAAAAFYFKLPPFASSNNNKGDTPTTQFVKMDKTQSEQEAIKDVSKNPSQKTQNNQTDVPEQPKTASNGKKAVNVLLTNTGIFNDKASASGVVTDIVEQGGTCAFTFTNGSSVVTKTSSTLTNSTSTSCETVAFPASELQAAGTWKVQISYQSTDAEGISNSKELTK